MTCIVGLVDKSNNVWIGGDSAGVADYDVTIRKDEKVWKHNGFVFGYTSSFRMGQLLRYKLNPTPWDGKGTFQSWIASVFVEDVRKVFKAGGFMVNENGAEIGGVFLVGHKGHLFSIDSDLQFGESYDNYMAVGCGANYALGSMYATPTKPPGQRIQKALECAVHYSAGVRPPFVIEKLRAPNVATKR